MCMGIGSKAFLAPAICLGVSGPASANSSTELVGYPLVNTQRAIENDHRNTIEIVELPIDSMVILHTYVNVYQRVLNMGLQQAVWLFKYCFTMFYYKGVTILMNLNQAKFNMHEHATSCRKMSNQLKGLLEPGFIWFHHFDVFHTTSRFSPVSASFLGINRWSPPLDARPFRDLSA